MNMEKKYDLDWLISNIDRDYVIENPDSVITLLQCMKSELDNRKSMIQELRSQILLLKAVNNYY